MDVVTLHLAKKYADETMAGAGAIKGDKGDKGDPGPQGPAGPPGPAGDDGFSPIVTVEDINGGHRVTITDAGGPQSFDVMDGKDGAGGSGGGGVPSGCILIWSGSSDAVPVGWALCNGQQGTPDLRDRFVLSAGNNHAVGETGGSEEVTLTVAQMPEHSHNMQHRANGSSTVGDFTFANRNASETSTIPTSIMTGTNGSSKPHPNMPPYYTLCYIMKL